MLQREYRAATKRPKRQRLDPRLGRNRLRRLGPTIVLLASLTLGFVILSPVPVGAARGGIGPEGDIGPPLGPPVVSAVQPAAPGVRIHPTNMTVIEGELNGTYAVNLTSAPKANVNVTITTGTQLTTSRRSLLFTNSTWWILQFVLVVPVDDSVWEGNRTQYITHSAFSGDPAYNGIPVASVSVYIIDNEVDAIPPSTSVFFRGTAGENGWFTSDVTVSLPATDAMSGVAATYDRLDGGAFSLYSAPVVVPTDGTHVMDFYSVDRAGNTEAVRQTGFRVDQTVPIISDFSTSTQLLSGDLTVRWSATDATSGVERAVIRLDSGMVAQTADTTYTFHNVSSGPHVVYLTVYDRAGNAVSQSRSSVVALGEPTISLSVTAIGLGVGVAFVIQALLRVRPRLPRPEDYADGRVTPVDSSELARLPPRWKYAFGSDAILAAVTKAQLQLREGTGDTSTTGSFSRSAVDEGEGIR